MKPDKETQEKWLHDPNNWKWNFFYYNKEDKRICPPKRNPAMGVTVNFANKKSIAVFVFFLLVLIVLIKLLTKGFGQS
jgi:uncharacterized membrane protein